MLETKLSLKLQTEERTLEIFSFFLDVFFLSKVFYTEGKDGCGAKVIFCGGKSLLDFIFLRQILSVKLATSEQWCINLFKGRGDADR